MSDLLAIDTSGSACSLALGRGEDFVLRHVEAPRQQIEIVLPLVHELLAERGTRLSQLDGLAYGQGPGSFTGIRIALAVVQGLALAHNLPAVGVSSLAAVAQGANRITGCEAVLVAQDARMGEVYWGCYELIDGAMAAVGSEQLSAPAGVRPPDQRGWLGVGTAWHVHELRIAGVSQRPGVNVPEVPHAVDILHLAERAFAAGLQRDAAQVRPSYLRQQVAQVPGGRLN